VLRTILYTALAAGLLAGAVVSVAQALRVVPLILEAETYEGAAGSHDHDHGEEHVHAGEGEAGGHHAAWAPSDVVERMIATVGANLLAGVGFALLLSAALSLGSETDWRSGLQWGLGGFAAFSLAPAIGLPPEPPGTAAAELYARQVWWVGTAVATAVGLMMITRLKSAPWPVVGVALLALPHVIGAPQPEAHMSTVPETLSHAFVSATLVTNLLFWAVLGASVGFLFERLRTAHKPAAA